MSCTPTACWGTCSTPRRRWRRRWRSSPRSRRRPAPGWSSRTTRRRTRRRPSRRTRPSRASGSSPRTTSPSGSRPSASCPRRATTSPMTARCPVPATARSSSPSPPEEATVPISERFSDRLLPLLGDLVAAYGTPFHIYDAAAAVETYRSMVRAFAGVPYRQYFAVKALPNPAVLSLLLAAGSGLDCSSPVEIELATRVGATGEDIVFTANNTSVAEYEFARSAGALVTLDDRRLFEKAETLPETVAFRVSPHGLAAGSALMGDTVHSKFGVP